MSEGDLAKQQRIDGAFHAWLPNLPDDLPWGAELHAAYRAGYAQAEADAKQDNEPDEGLPYCTCIGCREAQQAEADAVK